MHTPLRRASVALVALAAAAALLRPQLSHAIVVRADDLSYRGESARAREFYERALVVDPHNPVALDRLAFGAILRGHDAPMAALVDRISVFLSDAPSAELLQDRAMLELKLHRYDSAEHDFGAYAVLSRDPRASTFAGFAALKAGRRAVARAHFTDALRYDAHFNPARLALARVPR